MQRDLNRSGQSGSRRNSNAQQRVTFIEEAEIAPFLAVSFGQKQPQSSSEQLGQYPLNSLNEKYQREDWGRHHLRTTCQQDCSDELHFHSKSEFNEDTLRKYPKKEEETKNQANISNESITMRGRKKETNSPKIKDYLTQMIVSQENMQPILVNSFSKNSRSSSNNNQRDNPKLLEDMEQQRTSQILPVPAQLNKLSTSSLSCSEIAYLKQKQQNLSKEKAREEKQKNILKEIAFFYQKLAADKKQNQEQQNNQLAHFQSVQHSVASPDQKRVHSSSLKRNQQKEGQKNQGNINKKSLNRNSVEINKQNKQSQNALKSAQFPRIDNKILNKSTNLSNQNTFSNDACSLFGLLKLTPVQMNYFEKKLVENKRDNNQNQDNFQNVGQKLKTIRMNCLNEVLNGAKEVIELGESYFTIMHDLQTTSKQEPKESIMLLQDIKLRLLQKLFFAVLGRMQTPYLKQVRRRIQSYSQKRETELKLRCFTSWLERSRKAALKLRLVKVARKEAKIRLLVSGFTALKLNVQEHAFYRPIFLQIKQKRNQKILKNCLNRLSKYAIEKRLRHEREELCCILANQHIKTKSFLILKAFSCLKKSGSAVQVVTSQNITTRKIAKQIKQINQELQKVLPEDSQMEDDNKENNNKVDLEMLERHFVCEEEYLTSARQLQKVQREITLEKISQLKQEIDQENMENKNNNNNRKIEVLHNQEDIQQCGTLTQLKTQVIADIRKIKKLRKSYQKIINESDIDVLRAAINGINKKKNKKAITVNEQHFMLKLLEESQSEKLKICTYFKWRIVFLKRQIDRSLDMMVAIQAAQKGLRYFRERIRNNEEICQLHLAIKEEQSKAEIFSVWKNIFQQNSKQSQIILDKFKMRQSLQKIKCYVAHQKIQRMADNFHKQKLLKKLISSWSRLSEENQGVRSLSKRLLSARTFKFWQSKYNKILFLREFFSKVIYSPSELIKQKYPTDKSLLRNILQSWKNQVVDNDNTIQQQLNNQTAIQHRKITLKTRIFFEWVKMIKSRKALQIIFNSTAIAKGLFNRLINPWRRLVEIENNKIEQFVSNHNRNTAFKALHVLKLRYFRNRIAKITFLRRFFSAWKKTHMFICYENPQQIRTTRLLRASFTGFIMKQLQAVRHRTKIEKSTQLFLFNIKKFLSKCMNEWQQYTLKRRSKNLLQVKLKKYSEKQLKKRVLYGFSICLIRRKLKQVQNEKAQQFRRFQDHKHFDLQIQAAQNTTFYSPGYQLFLGIIHYWRLFAIKQKTITRISNRIQKFKERKTKQDTFQKWCDIYYKRVSSKSVQSAQSSYQIISKQQSSLESQAKASENKNLKNPTLSQKARPQSFDGAQPFLPSVYSPSNQDNNLNPSNQTTLPRQISEAQMIALDSRKPPKDQPSNRDSNFSTLKIKQPSKTVRFELEEERGKDDFYSQKYIENEAFYQRLISSKK